MFSIQKWKTKNNDILPIDMGYFDYSINGIKGIVINHSNKEALYIVLRKITSEQMSEIDARNFIYAFFVLLEIADDIPQLELNFQKIIANKNMEAIIKKGVSK